MMWSQGLSRVINVSARERQTADEYQSQDKHKTSIENEWMPDAEKSKETKISNISLSVR